MPEGSALSLVTISTELSSFPLIPYCNLIGKRISGKSEAESSNRVFGTYYFINAEQKNYSADIFPVFLYLYFRYTPFVSSIVFSFVSPLKPISAWGLYSRTRVGHDILLIFASSELTSKSNGPRWYEANASRNEILFTSYNHVSHLA